MMTVAPQVRVTKLVLLVGNAMMVTRGPVGDAASGGCANGHNVNHGGSKEEEVEARVPGQ